MRARAYACVHACVRACACVWVSVSVGVRVSVCACVNVIVCATSVAGLVFDMPLHARTTADETGDFYDDQTDDDADMSNMQQEVGEDSDTWMSP